MTMSLTQDPADNGASTPRLSVVVPAHNEEDNLALLVEQMDLTIRQKGVDAELILVDDGSTDKTKQIAQNLMKDHHWVRLLHRPQCAGQSSAMYAGIQAADAPWIATLDADLQNDPADLLPMLERVEAGEADMVQGDRSANRRDTIARRYASIVGRTARRMLLGDGVRDTGCSARVMKASYAKQIPLQYKGMHR
ncbi:MAG: glycosyltransferase family 2 protein, partial [Phycisphaeraceae bacterium]